jgi:N-acylethanolamine-hydrolysing acid amidase
MAHYNDSLHQAMKLMDSFIPTQYQAEVEALAEYVLLPQLGEYGEEIVSAVEVSKVPLGKAVILNLIYDIEAACTSIVAEDNNGHIYHGRNLDFLLAPTLRRLAIHVEFYRGGQLVFHGTTYAGYVGLLTGMRPGAFAISLDQRNDGTPSWENLLQEIFYHNTRTSAWLIRDTLDSSGSARFLRNL